MEYQKESCFTEDYVDWFVRPINDSAAMVVDEAARLSYQLGQHWTQASALTPKVPAQELVSPKTAQTHRLSNSR